MVPCNKQRLCQLRTQTHNHHNRFALCMLGAHHRCPLTVLLHQIKSLLQAQGWLCRFRLVCCASFLSPRASLPSAPAFILGNNCYRQGPAISGKQYQGMRKQRVVSQGCALPTPARGRGAPSSQAASKLSALGPCIIVAAGRSQLQPASLTPRRKTQTTSCRQPGCGTGVRSDPHPLLGCCIPPCAASALQLAGPRTQASPALWPPSIALVYPLVAG